MKVIRSRDEIPKFATVEEAAEFWGTHEVSEELWASLPAAPPLVDREKSR